MRVQTGAIGGKGLNIPFIQCPSLLSTILVKILHSALTSIGSVSLQLSISRMMLVVQDLLSQFIEELRF